MSLFRIAPRVDGELQPPARAILLPGRRIRRCLRHDVEVNALEDHLQAAPSLDAVALGGPGG